MSIDKNDRRSVLKQVIGFGVIGPALYLLRTRKSSAAVLCFLRGTRILTTTGQTAIEDLQVGDRVVTPAGASIVRWVGTRSFRKGDGRGWQASVAPVRIAAGALADNVPSRDLYLSPEHKLLFDGVLVASRDLLNGGTVTHEFNVEGHATLDYFHIELDAHDAVLAEAAWAETFRVVGTNRERFSNFGTASRLRQNEIAEQTPYAPTVGFDGLRSVVRYAAGVLDIRANRSETTFRAIRARVKKRATLKV